MQLSCETSTNKSMVIDRFRHLVHTYASVSRHNIQDIPIYTSTLTNGHTYQDMVKIQTYVPQHDISLYIKKKKKENEIPSFLRRTKNGDGSCLEITYSLLM